MKTRCGLWFLCFFFGTGVAFAQVAQVEPQILTETDLEGKVAVVEVAPRFVTTVRLPEAVNSVVVGDPPSSRLSTRIGSQGSFSSKQSRRSQPRRIC